MTPALLVLAKEPVPGRVKTRLCPPCSPEQAAALAAAALADTVDAVRRAPGAARRVLAVAGHLPAPAGMTVLPQRGDGLGKRIAAAFADTGTGPVLQIGMDTPQAGPDLIGRCLSRLDDRIDAVLGTAEDGGWWALGLRDPAHAALVADVPMSKPDTGELTRKALTGAGLRVADLPVLRDVDTWADARAVAALAPNGRFAAAVARVTW